MESLLIIDFSWLYNKYYYVAKYNTGFTDCENLYADTARMLEQFLTLIEKCYPKVKVVLALDSPTSSLNNYKLYAGYKQNRDKESKKEVYKELNSVLLRLKKSLNSRTFVFIKAKNYEADQLIAYFVEKYHTKKKVLIFSGDKDLLQLTWYENVFISDKFKNGKFIVKNDEEIFDKFKNNKGESFTRISENKRDILKYRTLKGDTSDNLSSVFPRIKDKEIIEIIQNYWTSEEPLTDAVIKEIIHGMKVQNPALAEKLEENKDIWLRNFKIMNLFDIEDLKVVKL